MSRDPPRCVFCHEHGASNEHVFAQWISKVVPGDGPFGHGYSSAARRTKDASLLAVKTRAPCVACNTGWMSRLEEAAEPLLSGPITGAGPVDWDSSAQRTIATWATKTALMLDRALLNPRIEARLYAQLYQHGEPPDEFHVWLGSYGLAPDSNQWRAAWADHKTLDATAPSGSLRAVLTTFTVGHVMLQVGSYVREDRQPPDEFDRPPLPTESNHGFDRRAGSVTTRWMTSTTFAASFRSLSCSPSIALGDNAALRNRHRAQPNALRVSDAIATRSSPVHHVPGEPTCSHTRAWLSVRSSRTSTPAAE